MAIPNISDYITWTGTPFINDDWDSNFQTTVNHLADGTSDLVVNTVTANNGFDAQNSKITNVADGTESSDGINYGQLLDSTSQASAFVVYAVNSATRDSNGYANFINKVSDTEISFDLTENIEITYPDGTRDVLSTLNNITGISTDGTYIIYYTKGGGAVAQASTFTFTEGYTFPSSPAVNDVHLDISSKAFKQYQYNGSSWDLLTNQIVKLGQAIRTGGTLGTPVSYALNGLFIETQAIVANGTYTINHNSGYRFENLTITKDCLDSTNVFVKNVSFIATASAGIERGYSTRLTSTDDLISLTLLVGDTVHNETRTVTSGTAYLTIRRNF